MERLTSLTSIAQRSLFLVLQLGTYILIHILLDSPLILGKNGLEVILER